MSRETQAVKVGLLVIFAAIALAVGVFLIGEESNLFRRKNTYRVYLPNAEGLQAGNIVQLSGVKVGSVDGVLLAREPGQPDLEVHLSIDRRYAQRIRQNSEASIRTLGLLGDKYLELTAGAAEAPLIPDGGEIPAAEASGVDQLVESGGDIAQHIISISKSLSQILAGIQNGEGVLGDLMSSANTDGRSLTKSLFGVVDSVERITQGLEAGEGSLGMLLQDRSLADELRQTTLRLNSLLAKAESGDGLLPALLQDGGLRQRVDDTLSQLSQTAARLDATAERLEGSDGLLPKLLNDPDFADKVSRDLEQLLERLNNTAELLSEGEGTAAQLLRNPDIYQALDDLVVGINDAKLLRWMIRNRQRAGAKKRFKKDMAADAQETEVPREPEDISPPQG